MKREKAFSSESSLRANGPFMTLNFAEYWTVQFASAQTSPKATPAAPIERISRQLLRFAPTSTAMEKKKSREHDDQKIQDARGRAQVFRALLGIQELSGRALHRCRFCPQSVLMG